MNLLTGILFHLTGSIAAGSFYVPYTRVKKWSWESMWIVGGLFSWLITPFLAAWLTVPGFLEIINLTDGKVIFWTYFLGLLWGIGGLSYGLGIRYLGMSLGSSLMLGLTAAFGALLPSVYYDIFPEPGKVSFSEMLMSSWGQFVLLGVGLCIIGIAVCGKAGIMKDRDLSLNNNAIKESKTGEFRIKTGIVVAIISGILSACFNYGIEAGKPMAFLALENEVNPLFQNNVIFVILLLGGLTTNFFWCLYLNIVNKSIYDYTNTKSPLITNYLFSALAGTIWFLQFFFYGMGESRLGNGASSWILHMAFIIIIGNLWGLILKEWSGVRRKTLHIVLLGLLVILVAIILVGYGNSIKPH